GCSSAHLRDPSAVAGGRGLARPVPHLDGAAGAVHGHARDLPVAVLQPLDLHHAREVLAHGGGTSAFERVVGVVGMGAGQRGEAEREHHADGQHGAEHSPTTRRVRHRRNPARNASGASELTASESSELRTACASVNAAPGGSTWFGLGTSTPAAITAAAAAPPATATHRESRRDRCASRETTGAGASPVVVGATTSSASRPVPSRMRAQNS